MLCVCTQASRLAAATTRLRPASRTPAAPGKLVWLIDSGRPPSRVAPDGVLICTPRDATVGPAEPVISQSPARPALAPG